MKLKSKQYRIAKQSLVQNLFCTNGCTIRGRSNAVFLEHKKIVRCSQTITAMLMP